MNVLVDFHHSGLYHSWQLMARRFGWTLYTPGGHAWWDEWYYSFGRSTYNDDRLAQQFLMATGRDGEFPNEDIARVTLAEAQEMDWAYVIATVPDNEPGFHRFAVEHGAQYVIGVGNTGQFVDWSLDPLALVSSEMPIEGRGVVYHQEMDPIAYRPPWTNRFYQDHAASFVNCMPQMGGCWDRLEAAQNTLRIDVFGINGPDGIIKPYSDLIDTMATYGWGWHDKAQGDGFGHIIHSWAAVGRPLIGHGSHYRGKLGEHFWQDGVTCLDLDKRSVDDVCAIVRTISAEDHEAMCRAIRAEYDTIDYDAEAERIADLLGLAVPA